MKTTDWATRSRSVVIAQPLTTPLLGAYGEAMIILVVILLALWLILAVVGFAIKGLVWLAVIGIILFLATAIIGLLRRRTRSRRTDI